MDPGFESWKTSRVQRACAKAGLECYVASVDVPSKLKPVGLRPCFVCARERRKTLFRYADRVGASKIALAHHMEDVTETLLMNLLMTSSGSTFLPRQELFQGRLTVIRPLYYVEKPSIRSYLRSFGIRPVVNRCSFSKNGMRLLVRRFLERLYRKDRRLRTNIFWGIHNLKPEYLPSATRTPGQTRPTGSDPI